jgi:hypothetical protein
MGWASCGKDSRGRHIGYSHSARCDHPGCKRRIDRGLSYACGGMHGEGTWSCEGYFCPEHMKSVDAEPLDLSSGQLCFACFENLVAHVREHPEDFSADFIEDNIPNPTPASSSPSLEP